MNYIELIPVIVAALQEQQNTIEYLTASLQEYRRTCCPAQDSDSSANEDAKTGRNLVNPQNGISQQCPNAVLYQNTPNPFTSVTSIEYFIPNDASDAILYIFNLSGVLVQTLPITATGHGATSISASSLSAGMYIYTLAVDGKIIDSKRMILTE